VSGIKTGRGKTAKKKKEKSEQEKGLQQSPICYEGVRAGERSVLGAEKNPDPREKPFPIRPRTGTWGVGR